MKHSISQRKLNRTSAHRKTLLMNLSNSLFKHEQITTTLPKAKELKPFVEKIISLGKKETLHAKRKVNSILQDKKNIKKIFEIFAERYKDRKGGYTRIVKLGNRYGDNAPTAIIELVDREVEAKGKDSGPIVIKKSENIEEENNLKQS